MSEPTLLRTKSDVMKLSNEELKQKIRTPDGLAEVNRALNATDENPVLTPEEEAAKTAEAQQAAEAAAVAEAAAAAPPPPPPPPVVPDDSVRRAEAEAAAYKAAGLTVEKDSSGSITRIIKEYQAKDEQGNPIGRPTHLEASSWVDLSIKEQVAHENATRAFHRLKSQKISFKNQQPVAPEFKELTDEEMFAALEDMKSDDKSKAVAAARKLAGSEAAKANEAARIEKAKAEGERIGYEFMKRHIHDFNPCQANSQILGKFLTDNEPPLEFTLDNLELAFLAVESQLAPVQVQVPVAAVPSEVNPSAPAPTAASAASAAPAATVPAAAAAPAAIAPPATPAPTAPPAVPANPEPPAPRPGVNGGIQPGSLSRPAVVATSTLTKADILKMDKEKLKRLVKDPNKRAELNAILAASAKSA